MTLARRTVALDVRELSDAGSFAGYGSVFDVLDDYDTIVRPGAFARSLAEHIAAGTWPVMLWGHDPDEPIGEWSEVGEDERGLKVAGQLWMRDGLPNVAKAYRSMRSRGKVGLSIGFRTREEQVDRQTGKRDLLDIELWEVSVVTFPANPAARVTDARATREEIDTERQFEAFLREHGFSRREAERLCRGGWKSLEGSPRDEGAAGTSADPQGQHGQHDPRDEEGAGLKAILAELRAVNRQQSDATNP